MKLPIRCMSILLVLFALFTPFTSAVSFFGKSSSSSSSSSGGSPNGNSNNIGATATLPFSANATSFVRELTEDTFVSEVMGKDAVWIVAFYKPTEESCKAFARTWEEVAFTLQGLVQIGAVDASMEAKTAWISTALKITTVPTVVAFPSRLTTNAKKGQKIPTPIMYSATELDVVSLVKWGIKRLPTHLIRTVRTTADLKKFHNDTAGYPRAVLFHNFTSVPPILPSLSLDYADRIFFAEYRLRGPVTASNTKSLPITLPSTLPAIAIYPVNVSKPMVHEVSVSPRGSSSDVITKLTATMPEVSLEIASVKSLLAPQLLPEEVRDRLRELRRKQIEEDEKKQQERRAAEAAYRKAQRKTAEEEAKRKRREKRKILKEREEQYQVIEKLWQGGDGEYIQVRDEGWDDISI